MSLGKYEYKITDPVVFPSTSSYSCLSGEAIVLQAEDLGVVVIERGELFPYLPLRGIYTTVK